MRVDAKLPTLLLCVFVFGGALSCGVRFGSKKKVSDGTLDGALDSGKDGGVDAALKPDAEVWHDAKIDAEIDAADPCVSSEHIFTQTAESFVVPSDVRYMVVKAWGGGANEEEQCGGNTGKGGPGGFTAAVFDVSESAVLITAGTTLSVVVGRRVQASTPDAEVARRGFPAPGGGGLSGVFMGAFPLTHTQYNRAVIIAGGGGSAGSQNPSNCSVGRPGNAPSAGGRNDMKGGQGSHDNLNGGGGGFRGGNGGPWGEAAWGGTEYVPENHPDLLDFRVEYAEQGIWTAPMDGDPDHDGTAGNSQEPGRVVIRFVCTLPDPL
jgi:hypothetical protein